MLEYLLFYFISILAGDIIGWDYCFYNIDIWKVGCFPTKDMQTSDGSVVSFQKTAVAVLVSVVVFFKTAVAVLMRL